MKTTSKLFLSLTLAGTVITVGALTASAYRGDPSVQGPSYNEERHEIMQEAFENNDYASWKEQMEDKGRVTEVVNEENFATFAQAHKLAEEGNLEAAQEIRAELGLGLRNGEGRGQGRGHGKGRGHGQGCGGNRMGNQDSTGCRAENGTCPYSQE